MSSINDKLERVRKPRVHIKYEIETDGAPVEKELPFVVGVLSDLNGNHSSTELKPLKDRKLINIDRDNFDQVMKNIGPGLHLRVENTLAEDGSDMNVSLHFNKMADFEPENLVNNIPALKQLLEARNKLNELLTKTDSSPELEALLEKALQDPEALQMLAKQLNQ
ncbi:MAG: type VI secretion system-associated protein [Gammaproteobacteria bacterium RIFCSPHIGHO2_12_FULL_41_15]|nr:MAG: type VI secretion system-associated protein [Gammaproteobacteria bacterium RIFCSPHIGHO2_12_FULL_41_15]